MGIGRQKDSRPGGGFIGPGIFSSNFFDDNDGLAIGEARHHLTIEFGPGLAHSRGSQRLCRSGNERHGFQLAGRFRFLGCGLWRSLFSADFFLAGALPAGHWVWAGSTVELVPGPGALVRAGAEAGLASGAAGGASVTFCATTLVESIPKLSSSSFS